MFQSNFERSKTITDILSIYSTLFFDFFLIPADMAQAIVDICVPPTERALLDEGEITSTRWRETAVDVLHVSSQTRVSMAGDLSSLQEGQLGRDENCEFSSSKLLARVLGNLKATADT